MKLLALTPTWALPLSSNGDQGADGGVQAKTLAFGKEEVCLGSAGESSGHSASSQFIGQSVVHSVKFFVFTSVLLATEQAA